MLVFAGVTQVIQVKSIPSKMMMIEDGDSLQEQSMVAFQESQEDQHVVCIPDGMVPEEDGMDMEDCQSFQEQVEFHQVSSFMQRVVHRFRGFDERGLPVELLQISEQLADPEQTLGRVVSSMQQLHTSFSEQLSQLTASVLEGVQVDRALVTEVTSLLGKLADLQELVACQLETQVEQNAAAENLERQLEKVAATAETASHAAAVGNASAAAAAAESAALRNGLQAAFAKVSQVEQSLAEYESVTGEKIRSLDSFTDTLDVQLQELGNRADSNQIDLQSLTRNTEQ